MENKNYDHITCGKQHFNLRFQTYLDGLNREHLFDCGIAAISELLTAFKYLVRPTAVTYIIYGVEEEDRYEKDLTDKNGLTPSELIESIRETADRTDKPKLTLVNITESTRITLSNGVKYLPDQNEGNSVVQRSTAAGTSHSPLTLSIRHSDGMWPGQTQHIDVTGYSDHWLNGDIEKFDLPKATPLAKIDQLRLAAALSNLYDAINPDEIIFDTFENIEGWHTAKQTVPGYESLLSRHAIEWVLENFEQRRPNDNTLELEYLGDKINPLIANVQGRSPDEKVQQFLSEAIPKDRYEKGATATVYYPKDTTVFVRENRNRWSNKSRSEF